MKIAIIGTGNVGNALGANWKKSNHEIIYGSRNPQD
jgi:predicted dinucleotide-binding enzyme